MSTTNRPAPRKGPSGAWNRLKPPPTDPLDAYGLPSKGETKLNDPKAQEAYYTKIVERYTTLCASAPDHTSLSLVFSTLTVSPPAALSPSSSPFPSSSPPTPPPSSDLALILLSLRKLREALIATSRTDTFAQRAYKFTIRASILVSSWESYLPALHHLLHNIHPRTPLSVPEFREFASYLVLDLACRQYELGEAYAARKRYGLKDRRVDAVLAALARDDWVRYWRVRGVVDGYVRAVMEFGAGRMREHVLKCIGKGYLKVEKGFVERAVGGMEWERLTGVEWTRQSGEKYTVGWVLGEDGVVVVRKPKGGG